MTLEKFRVGDPLPTEPWKPAPLAPVGPLEVLAFDQSLSATGWVLIAATGDTELSVEVLDAGTIKTESDKGHEGSLQRGVAIHRLVRTMLMFHASHPDLVVHEIPPVGNKMTRPESSLLAAQAIRIAADGLVPVRMYGAQSAKVRFGGSRKATKAEVRAGLATVLRTFHKIRPMNEHVSDALALGLLALEDGR